MNTTTKIQKKSFCLEVGNGCLLKTEQVLGPLSSILRKTTHGILHLSVLEEGVSLTLNENCDPTVRSDMKRAMVELFQNSEIIKGAVVGPSLDLVISNGHIITGTWQGIYICNWEKKKNITIEATIFSSSIKGGKFSHNANYRGAHDITSTLQDTTPKKQGIITCVLQHTSASITINQSSKDSEKQLENGVNYLVPEKWNNMFFEHTYEGPDDMPGHMKSTLIGAHFTLPVAEKSGLQVGNNQSAYLFEHRNTGGWGGGHHRKIAYQFIESTSSFPLKISTETATWTQISENITKNLAKMNITKKGVIFICSLQGNKVFLQNCDEKQCFDIEKAVTSVTTSGKKHYSHIQTSLFRSSVMIEVKEGGKLGGGVSVYGGEEGGEGEFVLHYFEE